MRLVVRTAGRIDPLAKLLNHAPIILMSFVAAWLAFGAAFIGDRTASLALIAFCAFLLVIYLLFLIAGRRLGTDRIVTLVTDHLTLSASKARNALWAIGIFAIALSLVHYFFFDGFTLLRALASHTVEECELIRSQVTNGMPTWLRYASAFVMQSFFPMGLLFAIYHRQKSLSALLALFGGLYAICLMQKANTIIFILPALTFYLLTFRLSKFVVGCLVSACLVFFMGFTQNPQIRPPLLQHTIDLMHRSITGNIQPLTDESPSSQSVKEHSSKIPTASGGSAKYTAILAHSFFIRIFLTPGHMVSSWIQLVPAKYPFANGCAYRIVAHIKGCMFQNFQSILYRDLYPEQSSVGVKGTANAASMMVGYVNFGWIGFFAYAPIQAALAWMLHILFRDAPILSLPINITYLGLLSSASLFTLLFSGGWATSILLFILIGRAKNSRL